MYIGQGLSPHFYGSTHPSSSSLYYAGAGQERTSFAKIEVNQTPKKWIVIVHRAVLHPTSSDVSAPQCTDLVQCVGWTNCWLFGMEYSEHNCTRSSWYFAMFRIASNSSWKGTEKFWCDSKNCFLHVKWVTWFSVAWQCRCNIANYFWHDVPSRHQLALRVNNFGFKIK